MFLVLLGTGIGGTICFLGVVFFLMKDIHHVETKAKASYLWVEIIMLLLGILWILCFFLILYILKVQGW